jgi:hypothetical protein
LTTREGRLAGILAALLPAFLAAACSGAPAARPAVPPPTVETVSGQALGAQAAAGIDGSEPVTFPAMVFDGPVATVSRNTVLGGLSSTRVFATPKGSLTVRYTAGARAAASPAEIGDGARACVFSRTAASGTYTVTGGTGSFAGASGHGTYTLVFITETARAADGSCSPAGKAVPAGDQVDFTAGGPLTVTS